MTPRTTSLGISLLAVVLALTKGQEPASQYYRELGCTPPDSGNPLAYNCSVLDSLKPDKCFYNNKAYAINDVLKGDDIDSPCIHECICLKGYIADNVENGANWQCVQIECPELFNPPKNNCISLYSKGKCCSGKTHCPGDEEPEVKCEYKGKTYIEGQGFGEECKTCVCQKGFNGTLTEPFCTDIKCDFYLHYSRYIHQGCLPTYYEPNNCCPIPIWRCPGEEDAVLTQKNAPEDTSGLKCKFGNLELSVGQRLNPTEENKCVECTCLAPPHPTCVMNTTCYSNQ